SLLQPISQMPLKQNWPSGHGCLLSQNPKGISPPSVGSLEELVVLPEVEASVSLSPPPSVALPMLLLQPSAPRQRTARVVRRIVVKFVMVVSCLVGSLPPPLLLVGPRGG